MNHVEGYIRKVVMTFVCGLLVFVFCTSCTQSDSQKLSQLTFEVAQMDSCRLRSQNRDFYLHKYKADKIMDGYSENYTSLPDAEQQKYIRARLDYSFSLTDYYRQVGMHKEARNVMEQLASDAAINLVADTIHWLNFLCHEATAYYHPYNVSRFSKDILKGYDCLAQCYFLSQRSGVEKYKAISMMLLSQYLSNPEVGKLIRNSDPAFLRYLNEDGVAPELLAGNLAERALVIFITQDDHYYEANGWLTLADCFFNIGNSQKSVECLQNALKCNEIKQTPDLLASVNEQLSMSHAALGQKQFSDYYRNKYLDLQDSTRQDRLLEARVEALNQSNVKIWGLVAALLVLFVTLCIVTIVLFHLRKRNAKRISQSEEEIDELEEQKSMYELKLSQYRRSTVDQRAKVQMVNSMVPLIDRMRLAADTSPDYVVELAELIEKQNGMLTRWIKLEQGSIAPKIETINLNDVFLLIKAGHKAHGNNNVAIVVKETDVAVKADRALTIFLVNTLVDNAYSALGNDGKIEVSCIQNQAEGFAEVSVSDNGKGISEDKLQHLFDYRPIQDSASNEDSLSSASQSMSSCKHQSHGFGLQNCRGIINRYRKISSIFSVCNITAESRVGEGTSIKFRLPLAVKNQILVLVTIMTFASSQSAIGQTTDALNVNVQQIDALAASYCDSLYSCNLTGRYHQALLYADSCKAILKQATPDTTLLLSLYNETAVAAMAVGNWEQYQYNNYIYTRLFKESTRDTSIDSYSQTIERNNIIANVAVLVIIMLILALIPVFWFVYLRPMLAFRGNLNERKRMLREDISVLQKECDRLHIIGNITSNQLSTLKHETMYYPSRVLQILKNSKNSGCSEELSSQSNEKSGSQLHDIINLYRNLYVTLSSRAISEQAAKYSFEIKKINLADFFCVPDDVTVLANPELMAYFKVLIKRVNGGEKPKAEIIPDAAPRYVSVRFIMYGISPDFFSVTQPTPEALIMRQIIRETGDATHAYASGIRTETTDETTNIVVTLPLAVSQFA